MAISSEFLQDKTTRQILKFDMETFLKLDEKALFLAVEKMSKTANRRLKEFERLDMTSPATSWAKRSGGEFTTVNKSFNQLRNEYRRVKAFLESETSTVAGYERVKNEVVTTLKNERVTITEDDYEKFWKAYELLKEKNPEVAEKEFKYKVLTEISMRVQDRRTTARSIARKIENKLEEIEKNGQTNTDGVSKFLGQYQEPDDDELVDI